MLAPAAPGVGHASTTTAVPGEAADAPDRSPALEPLGRPAAAITEAPPGAAREAADKAGPRSTTLKCGSPHRR